MTNPMRTQLRYFLFLILWILPFFLYAQDITVDELKDDIYFLASDSLKGRQAGSPEGFIAAGFIRDQLKEDGLRLLDDNGFQFFEVVTGARLGSHNFLIAGDDTAAVDVDFRPFPFSRNEEVSAPVVFAGYGFDISEDSLKWNDYNGVDVTGQWVMMFRGDPALDNNESSYLKYTGVRSKVLTAKDKGAAGVLLVTPEAMDEKDELVPMTFDKSASDAGLPVIHIRRELADVILKHGGHNIAELEQALKSNRQPVSFAVPLTVHAESDVILTKSRAQNVVAELPGGDPVLKDETIVIGAHYDHLGMGGPGSGSRIPDTLAIHNGADDNASGVAGILALARKMSTQSIPFKRTVLFVAFDGEEMGLLGSKYFVNHSPVDPKQIKTMFNFDMIGRLKTDTRSLLIGGTGTGDSSEAILNKNVNGEGFELKFSPEGYGASDHSSFYARDIPVFFFTTGAHEDYHTPSDDADKINYPGEKEVLDFAYRVIREVGDRDQPLAFREAGPKERPDYGRGFKVTLGFMPDFTSTENNGLRVDAVRKDGPAYRGGLLKGDIITAVNGKSVSNIYDYMNRLKELDHGQTISVDVMRNGEKEVLIIQL